MTTYVARLCFNTAGWTRPTGDCGELENNTFAAGNGFGHEEWLFDHSRQLDGWRYGFLQPVSRGRDPRKGEVMDVALFTIGPKQAWWWVGSLRNCEILHREQAELARRAYRKRGWLQEMQAQLIALGANSRTLSQEDPRWLFNIRFRAEDAHRYDPLVPIAPSDPVRRVTRYSLTTSGAPRDVASWSSRIRSAAPGPKATAVRARRAVSATTIDPSHDRLQNELLGLLVKRYGASRVKLEANYVDITVRNRSGTADLYELKNAACSRAALREAVGQLLHYACDVTAWGGKVGKLVVAAPVPLDDDGLSFLRYLKTSLRLPIRYMHFHRGMTELQERGT